MKPAIPKPQRCIYTRKSTEHNLDLEFNSLDAPPELGPIGPDASQDHGDLAGYGDTRLSIRCAAPAAFPMP